MGAPDILGRLFILGLTAKADGERLLIEPKDAITDEARQLIRANKQAILGALRNSSPSPRVELIGLIRAVGTLYAFTSEETAEATQIAFADTKAALACYRDVASRYALNIPADDRVTCGECSRLVRGKCQAAKQGLMIDTQPDYSPTPDTPRRCEHFK